MHTGFLHARGKGATNTLIKEIQPKENLCIAEIGFGTGATLARLASLMQEIKISGVEISPDMYKSTIARLKFCGLSDRIELRLIDDLLILPFSSGNMDVVYAESVLSILENDHLPKMISEIFRILKPGGRMILNETIWMDMIPIEKIKKINQSSREAYGIIQANESFPYIDDWKELLLKNNLRLKKFEVIDSTHLKKQINLHLILSDCFSIFGKLKSNLNKQYRLEKKFYSSKMQELKLDEKAMEGYLIVAEKNQINCRLYNCTVFSIP